MSEQGIDKLKIELNATAKPAKDEVQQLIEKLYTLKQRIGDLDGDANSLNGVVDAFDRMSKSVNAMDAKKFKTISNGIMTFARSAQAMAGVSKYFATIQSSANGMKDTFNGVSTNKSEQELNELIQKEQETIDASKELKEFIRSGLGDLYIPTGLKKELGDLYKELVAFVGIKNTALYGKNGATGSGQAEMIEKALTGFDTSSYNMDNELDAFRALGETLKGLTTDIENGQAAIKGYEREIEILKNDFMTIDDAGTSDVLEIFGNAAQNAAKPVEDLASSVERLGGQNPFQSITDSLQQLQGIHLSVESLSGVTSLVNAVNKISTSGANAGATFESIASGLRELSTGMTLPDLSGMADFVKNIGKLGGKRVTAASSNLPSLAESIRVLSNMGDLNFPSIKGLEEFAQGINLLGRAKVTKAVENIPQLTNSLRQMMLTLQNAPQVSQNVIDMTNAMANLAAQGSKVGTSGRSLERVFGRIGSSSKSTRSLLDRLKSALSNVSRHFDRTSKSSRGLASSIGLLYAKFWALFRLFGLLKKAMDLSSDVTEVQNVVDTTFGKYSNLVNKMAQSSIEQFGMSELTVKQIASRFQAMGSAMDISSQQVKSATDYLARNNAVYDVTGNKMADMSIELTKLTADMASFYNIEQDVVAEDLAAIFTGQTRPLRKYGLDLTQATLKEWALSQGIDANIKSMSQAEKTMLRYQYVLAHTGYIMGDFQRTSDTWANQTRILRQNFEQLGIVIGSGLIQALKPAVKAMNAFLTKVTQFAQNVVNALGKIFGWKVEISTAGITDNLGESADAMEGISDGADSASSGLGDAAKNAKKLNEQLREWDKLNVITSQKNSSGGSGGGAGSGVGAGDLDGGDAEANIVRTEGLFHSMIKDLEGLGEYLNRSLKKTLLGIPWSEIQKKAYDFGKGFGEFIKGFTKDSETFYWLGNSVAQTVNTILKAFEGFADGLGKNGFKQIGEAIAEFINGISHGIDWATALNVAEKYGYGIAAAINGFVDKIDVGKIGRNLANLVNTISTFYLDLGKSINFVEIGKKMSDGVNGFLDSLNATKLGRAFNTWANGILDAADTAISSINWAKLGTKIGTLLSEINFPQLLVKFGNVLGKAIIGVIEGLTFAIKEAPVEAALIAAFAAFKFLGVGKIVGSAVSQAIATSIAASIGTTVAADATISTTLSAALAGKVTAAISSIGAFISNGFNSLLVALATSGTALGEGIVSAISAGMSIGLGPLALALAAVGIVVAKVHDDMSVSEREMEKVFTDTGMDECITKTESLKDSLNNLERASKDIHDVYQQDILNVGAQMSQIDALVSAYERLSGKETLTFDEQEKLKNVSSELVSIFPELNSYVNEQGVLVGVSASKFNELKSNLKETMELEAKRSEYLSYYNKYNEAVDNMRVAYLNYQDAIKNINTFQLEHKNMTIEDRKELEILKEKVDDAKDAYDGFGNYLDIYGEHLNNTNKELFDAETAFGSAQVAQDLLAQGVLQGDKNLVQMAQDLGKLPEINSDVASSVDSVNGSMKSFAEYSVNASSQYNNFAKGITDSNGNINKSQEEVMAYIEKQKQSYNVMSKEAREAIDELEKNVNEYYDDLNSKSSSGNQDLNTHEKAIKTLESTAASATKDMSSNMNNYSTNTKSAMAGAKSGIDAEKQSMDAAKSSTDQMVNSGSNVINAGDNIKRGADTGSQGMKDLKETTDDAKNANDNLMRESGNTFTINNSGFDSLTSKLKGILDFVRNLFDYDGRTVNVNTRVRENAGGGIFYGNKWHSITQYAGGGLPRTAELFMARENGLPEMVGSIGGHTAVMNNDQIVASVSDGVARAVSASMAQEISVLRQQNAYLREIASKNFGISSRDVFNATRQEANDYYRRTGNPAFA